MGRQLAGKVALITGGGRGLGRGVALEMARAGARVVIVDMFRDEQGAAGQRVVDEIEGAGGSGAAVEADVTDPSAAARCVRAAVDSFGRLDVLCTFAGNAIMKRMGDLTGDDFDASVAVHLKGTFNCVQAALPGMLAQRWGRIVTVSSRGAFQGAVPAYAAAKAGIMGLSAALAMEMEMGSTGVTVNCLLPSAVTQLFPTTAPRPLGGMPTPLTSDPDDVAPLVAYLATDDAASINGRFLYASGGDICVYGAPFQVANGSCILRSPRRWTIDELGPLLLPIAGAVST